MDILNFLADLFGQGLQYNTIAGYRSAISAYHDPIDGTRIGSHPKVTTLMTGAFNERCPKPRFYLQAYAFPPFSLIGRVLRKVEVDQATLLVVAPVWQGQPWFPKLLQLSIRNPILLPFQKDMLKNPRGESHPLLLNSSLRLAV